MKRRSNRKSNNLYETHGGAMITTLLILTAIMMGFLLAGLFSSVREKEGLTETDRMTVAEHAAVACADVAIDRLGRDENYAGNEDVQVDTNIVCHIRPVIFASTWTVETTATINGRVANYRIVLNGRNPVDISSWQKVQNF